MKVEIIVDDLSGADIVEFLAGHVAQMRAVSPPESTHALELDRLRIPEVTFWSLRENGAVLGCGAIQEIGPGHAEIKSMRTAPSHQNQGLASRLLTHILREAKNMGFARLSLETGSNEFFAPARRLYTKQGFTYCAPFADYRPDPNSVFMTRTL